MANGDTKVVEPFDSVAHWSVLETAPESVSDVWQPAGEVLKGDTAANFTWTEGSPLVSRGVFPGPPMVPLDVVASKSFLSANKQRLGETIQVTVQGHRLNVSLVDEIDYFPTFDTDKKSYLIGDLDSIFGYVNLQATGAELRPNEIWLSTEGDSAERSQLLDMLNDDQPFANRVVHDRLEALSNSRADPLVDAGWKALLFVAFAAVFVLSGIGFLVHAYVSFKGREVQFALMRTIGFTMGQLMTLVFIEQALVIGTGLALGTWMGGRLSATVMPFLGHDDRGIQVLPPFVNQITWDTLAITYAAMGLLFAFIVAGVIWFLRRLSLQRILRLGEM
jgi:ABC-type antimicrobial peptide transport system permease subunit